MEHKKEFEVRGNECMVCKLVKIFYGLKKVPMQWYKKFESFMAQQWV